MTSYIDKISELMSQYEIQHEIYSFDSGVFMFDVWINNDFYNIQIFGNKFGISHATEVMEFSTIPDKVFIGWEKFEFELKKIIDES